MRLGHGAPGQQNAGDYVRQLYSDILDSQAYAVYSGIDRIKFGVDRINYGLKMLLLPVPTVSEDLLGVGICVVGVFEIGFGIVEFVVAIK